ncbi:MAG: PepSY-associated TM helix domain-containing protein [Rouxiella aceris]|uniref:PepSY-associated TM helix domain-containing protein n=1 Tax=Rouxiella aceris TaxID=2703884 RepID=UPI002846125B|nr:PepSY-associated TM helix domain-containing protein [Rouxiella aceris]MDR3431885.1 PepSY-associated TM helix domain-containing protein [Rouxiella aceris]
MASLTTPISSPRGAMLNLVRRLHFYIGLFIAPFIFVAALTGTLYVLTPQVENILYQDALFTQPQGQAKPLAEQIAVARQHTGPETKIYAVRPAPGATDTTRVQFVSADLAASESRSVFVDPYTLAIKGDMVVYGTSGVLPLRTWLDKLHSSLLLGDMGRNYSELAASWLWVAALGGMALWLSSRPRRKAKRITGRFAVSRHWHITLGILLLAGLLFFSATGLTWSQWAGGNIDAMRANLGWMTPQVHTNLHKTPATPSDPHAEHHDTTMVGMAMPDMDIATNATQSRPSVNAANGDWDKVLSAARTAGIGAARVELRQPKGEGRAWTVTEVDRSWPTHVDAVAVDPQSFAVTDHIWFDKFPLIAKLTRWGIDAHMGILFGLANQLILAAFGIGLCLMIALGYRMWWLRRPAVGQANPVQTLFTTWLALSLSARLATLLVAMALGYCLPVMGASLLAFVLVDLLRWRGQGRSSQGARNQLASISPGTKK